MTSGDVSTGHLGEEIFGVILTKSIEVVKLMVMLETDRRAATTRTIDGAASSAAAVGPKEAPSSGCSGLARTEAPRPRVPVRRRWWNRGHKPRTCLSWSVGTSCSSGPRDFELWLIHWPTDGGLVLHDHGGSSGAFHVVWGALDETSTTRRGHALRQRRLVSSEGKSFGPDYVHSVVNPEQTVATSIHAYSPPLTSMNFYETSPAGLVFSRVETDWEGAP